jgi:hypothetical protein
MTFGSKIELGVFFRGFLKKLNFIYFMIVHITLRIQKPTFHVLPNLSFNMLHYRCATANIYSKFYFENLHLYDVKLV